MPPRLFSPLFTLALLGPAIAQGFDWESLEPSKNISWVDCNSGFQCARFQVPLNHSDPDNGQTVSIAMVKLPAKVQGAEYGGPIFTNPGGPGGSGVGDILRNGEILQNMTGSQFDIIGFDPRGVNMTTPKISAFQTAEEGRAFFQDEVLDVNSTADALPTAWARYQAYGQGVQNRDVNGTLNFVSTADVARDMLVMAEALGQDKLQYYGCSYGSFLGSVFATMFPDRVGRMIIDGVVDSEAYIASDFGTMSKDIDKVMQAFFDSCHSVGPERCPFFASTPSEIAANLDAIYDSLRAQPLPAVSADSFGIITYNTLKSLMWEVTRDPFTNFPILASGLAQLASGNTTGLVARRTPSDGLVSQSESFTAIQCSDSDPLNATASQLREYMDSVNSSFAGVVTSERTRCSGWKVHPENRFKGPVGANTSFPILLIGNTADGRTSIEGARKTSAAFPGSVMLTLDVPGHTTLITISSCINQHFAAYYSNGTLPEEGTVCQSDIELFGFVLS